MKKVTLILPDEVYYEYQTQAGKARRDTEDLIEEVVIHESGVEQEELITTSNTDALDRFVLNWDWPNGELKEGTKQAKNVIGVVRLMQDGLGFPDAAKAQADEVRKISEKDLAENYNTTVRAQCAKVDMGVTHGVEQFRKEVYELLQEYERQESA